MNDGKYMARGRTLTLGEAKTGTPQVAVGFEILDGGGHISWHGFLSAAAEQRTIEAIQGMGWEGNDITELPALMDAGKLSRVVEIVVVNEEYNGKVRPKIKFVNAVGGRMAPLKGGALAYVQARIKARIGEVGAQPPAGGDNDYGRGDPDDSLPFASASLSDEPHPMRRWRLPV